MRLSAGMVSIFKDALLDFNFSRQEIKDGLNDVVSQYGLDGLIMVMQMSDGCSLKRRMFHSF